jgi:hypothetical protein
MSEFLQKHFKLMIIIGGLIVVLLVAILLYLNYQSKTPTNVTPTVNADGLIIDSTNQFLLDNDISKEDKYLMLLSQSMVEDYGTDRTGDVQPLWDVQNQSTDAFNTTVQQMIDTIDKSKNVVTVVDPNSIKLNHSDATVTGTMTATTTDQKSGAATKVNATIQLVNQGTYWLVNNISYKNQ